MYSHSITPLRAAAGVKGALAVQLLVLGGSMDTVSAPVPRIVEIMKTASRKRKSEEDELERMTMLAVQSIKREMRGMAERSMHPSTPTAGGPVAKPPMYTPAPATIPYSHHQSEYLHHQGYQAHLHHSHNQHQPQDLHQPIPHHQQQGTTDPSSNLNWLVNFRIDSLFPNGENPAGFGTPVNHAQQASDHVGSGNTGWADELERMTMLAVQSIKREMRGMAERSMHPSTPTAGGPVAKPPMYTPAPATIPYSHHQSEYLHHQGYQAHLHHSHNQHQPQDLHQPIPHHQQQGTTDPSSNLNWLVNFRIDSLFPNGENPAGFGTPVNHAQQASDHVGSGNTGKLAAMLGS
ncbi:unnamed protein product [Cyprideis torosa]|uniref:Uncharacterized protein n=1 Tax=Cyprideis torosa TaxID=163714 RepID=A0A7R8WPU2_9CRUS|nr:unnamed protein product [Cyprideis torosa]CAG0901941.1 unnamed protein product [Cyprideis torosa]